MNERIREFKEQATRTAMWIGDPDAGELDAEKFAELIVRECAELATKEYNNRGAIHGNDLLDHFGVRE
jgi:hypothetical protein